MTNETPRTIEGAVACVRCGYDLRGVAVNGTCPECGAAAVDSLAASRSLTKRDVVFMAMRILALWIGVQAMLGIVTVGSYFVTYLSGLSAYGGDWEWMLPWTLQQVFTLGAGAGLWIGAATIARWVVPVDGTAVPAQQWSAGDLAAVAVQVLGLYLLVRGIAGVATLGWMLLTGRSEMLMAPIEMNPFSAVVSAVCGLVMVLGRRRLSRWWHVARTAGTR